MERGRDILDKHPPEDGLDVDFYLFQLGKTRPRRHGRFGRRLLSVCYFGRASWMKRRIRVSLRGVSNESGKASEMLLKRTRSINKIMGPWKRRRVFVQGSDAYAGAWRIIL